MSSDSGELTRRDHLAPELPVSNVPRVRSLPCRLVYDRDSGKPKGYGFCEFAGTSCPVFPSDGPLRSTTSRNVERCTASRTTRCTYSPPTDHETAASAVRNLNNVDVGGRPIRIDIADSDPFLEGKTTVRGEIMDTGGETRAQWRERGSGSGSGGFLASLPRGTPLPPGTSSMDFISTQLARMPVKELMDVLSLTKVNVGAILS